MATTPTAHELDFAVAEIVKANSQPKTYQGRTSKGTFGSGTRSGSGQSSTPKDKEIEQRHSPDQSPRQSAKKVTGQSVSRQSPQKMEMVHGRRDKITKDLESTRISNRSIPKKTNPDYNPQQAQAKREPYRQYRGEEVVGAFEKLKKELESGNKNAQLGLPTHALAQHYELAKRHGYGKQAEQAIAANQKANPNPDKLHSHIQELAKQHGLEVSSVADGHVKLSKDGKSFEVKVSDDKSPKEFAYSSGGVHVSTSAHPEVVKQKLDEIGVKAEALGAGLYVKGKTRDAIKGELDVNKKTAPAQRSQERSQESLDAGRQKLQAMKDHPTPEKIADFAAHAKTMHPDDAKQLAKEHGLRSKNGDTLAKEAHIASQERSKWQQEARKNGIDVDDFKRQAIAIRNDYNAGIEKYNQNINSHMTNKLSRLADKQRDYTSISGLDKDMEEFATQHADLFHGMLIQGPDGNMMIDPNSGADVMNRYEQIMAGGKLPKMSKQQSYEHSFSRLYAQKQAGIYKPQGRRKIKDTGGWDDDTPF